MIFVLDDMFERIEHFIKKFGKEEVDHVWSESAPEDAKCDISLALEKLRNNKYDMVFLDHDLGGGAYMRGKTGDGIDVAKAMAQEKLQTDAVVFVHTLNEWGRKDMVYALVDTHNVKVLPFTILRGMAKVEIEHLTRN